MISGVGADGATIANRAWRCGMSCLECGAESAEATEVCARCGAPGAHQRFVAEDLAAGWAATEAIPASAGQQPSESAQDSEVDGTILAEWVEATKFSAVRLRRGYDIDQVDAFLDAIRDTFLGIRGLSLTPDEIRNKQFSITLLQPGYHEEEVDAFLHEAELKLAAQVSARCGAPAAGQRFVASDPAAGALPIRCLKCGAASAEATEVCALCGAPVILQPSVAAEPEAGGPGDPIAPLAGGIPHQPTHRRPQPGYSWRDALILLGLGLAPVGGPGGVTVAERHHRWQAIACSLIFTFTVLPILGLGLSLSLPPGQHILAAAANLAGIAVVIWGCVWGCTRGWRMGVRLDDHGVTVRNFLRAYRFSWAEVRRFADGLIHETGQNGSSYFWALQVVLHDGRVVTAKGTARKKGARRQTLAAISQAAARHSVPAALTGIAMKGGSPVYPGLYPDPGGQPGLRHWDGEEWSPLLRADPVIGEPAKAQARAEVYSPLPGSQQQWHDAAARARRATALSAVWLVVAAGAAVGTVALIAHNISRPSDDLLNMLAVLVVLACLGAAWEAWKSRKKFRKIDQAAKEGEIYRARGQHRRPRHDRGEGLAAGQHNPSP
jgi:DivIVA domain-containing protein